MDDDDQLLASNEAFERFEEICSQFSQTNQTKTFSRTCSLEIERNVVYRPTIPKLSVNLTKINEPVNNKDKEIESLKAQVKDELFVKLGELSTLRDQSEKALKQKSSVISKLEQEIKKEKETSSKTIRSLNSQLEFQAADMKTLTSDLSFFQQKVPEGFENNSPASKMILLSQSPRTFARENQEEIPENQFITPTKPRKRLTEHFSPLESSSSNFTTASKRQKFIVSSKNNVAQKSNSFRDSFDDHFDESPLQFSQSISLDLPNHFLYTTLVDLSLQTISCLDVNFKMHSLINSSFLHGISHVLSFGHSSDVSMGFSMVIPKIRFQLLHLLETILQINNTCSIADEFDFISNDCQELHPIIIDSHWNRFMLGSFSPDNFNKSLGTSTLLNEFSIGEEVFVSDDEPFAGAPASQMPSAILSIKTPISKSSSNKNKSNQDGNCLQNQICRIRQDFILLFTQIEAFFSPAHQQPTSGGFISEMLSFMSDVTISLAEIMLAEFSDDENESRWDMKTLSFLRESFSLFSLRLIHLIIAFLRLFAPNMEQNDYITLPSLSIIFYLVMFAVIYPTKTLPKEDQSEDFKRFAIELLIEYITILLSVESQYSSKFHSHEIWTVGRNLIELNPKNRGKLFLELTNMVNQFHKQNPIRSNHSRNFNLLSIPQPNDNEAFLSSVPIEADIPQFPNVCPLWLLSNFCLILSEYKQHTRLMNRSYLPRYSLSPTSQNVFDANSHAEALLLSRLSCLISTICQVENFTWPLECPCKPLIYRPLINLFGPFLDRMKCSHNSYDLDRESSIINSEIYPTDAKDLCEANYRWLNAISALRNLHGDDYSSVCFEYTSSFFNFITSKHKDTPAINNLITHLRRL